MKRKSLNKLLALGMTAVMTAGLLTGCGGSGNGASAPANDAAQSTSETESADTDSAPAADTGAADSEQASGEVPTLIWWTVGGTPADDFDEAVAQISDYCEEKIGVRLDVKIAGWGDYDTKMNTIVNAGEYFDIKK